MEMLTAMDLGPSNRVWWGHHWEHNWRQWLPLFRTFSVVNFLSGRGGTLWSPPHSELPHIGSCCRVQGSSCCIMPRCKIDFSGTVKPQWLNQIRNMTFQIRFWKHKYKKCHKTEQGGRQAATQDPIVGKQGHHELGCAERPVGKGGFKLGLGPVFMC